MEHQSTLLPILIAFVAAMVGGELAMRLRFPAVVGQILAGVIVGRSVLNVIPEAALPTFEILGELGAAFLLFAVGIETPLENLAKVGKSALRVAVLGVIFPFVLGFAWAHFSGLKFVESAFVASAFIATSAGITAKVLQELGVLDKRYAQVILGAAVIDDVLAMLVLSMVSSLATGKEFNPWAVGIAFFQSIAFIVAFVLVGRQAARKKGSLLGKPLSPLSPWTLSIALCIGTAVLASYIGLAAIIGAFLVGMILAETQYKEWIHEKVVDLNEFIVPFFFIITGMSLDVAVFKNPLTIGALLLITALAIVSKFLGGYLGAGKGTKTYRSLVGIGMVPRGEVGVIVAGLGQQFGVFTKSTYSLLVAMSLLTSIVAAPILGKLVSLKREAEKEGNNKKDGSGEQT